MGMTLTLTINVKHLNIVTQLSSMCTIISITGSVSAFFTRSTFRRLEEVAAKPRREHVPMRIASFSKYDRAPSPMHDGNNYNLVDSSGYNLSPAAPPAYSSVASSRGQRPWSFLLSKCVFFSKMAWCVIIITWKNVQQLFKPLTPPPICDVGHLFLFPIKWIAIIILLHLCNTGGNTEMPLTMGP